MNPTEPQPLIIELWKESHARWAELTAFVDQLGQSDWVTFSADFHKSSHMLVAMCGQKIAGFLRYVIQEVGAELDRPVVLRDGVVITEAKVLAFAVAPHYRNQGVGRALQMELLQVARQQDCYQIRSHSSGTHSANHALKLSLGFGVHPIIRGDDDEGVYFIMPLELRGRRASPAVEEAGARAEPLRPSENTDHVHIRHATAADVPALCDLYLEFHEFHAEAVPDRLQSLRLPGRLDKEELGCKVATLLHEDHALLQVAEIDGQIIGLAELYLREDDKENPAVVVRRYAHLQSLIVTADARRNGVGRALLKAAETWAAENGAEEVHLEVWEFAGGPLGFYATAGYRTLKRTLIRQLGDATCDAS